METEEKVKMVERPEDAGNVFQDSKKKIRRSKKPLFLWAYMKL